LICASLTHTTPGTVLMISPVAGFSTGMVAAVAPPFVSDGVRCPRLAMGSPVCRFWCARQG